MKKIAKLCLCAAAALSLLAGCSGSAEEGQEDLGTVTLAEYKGVTVNVPPAEVTDEDVENRIQSVLSQNQEEVEVDRAAEEGDVVNIDYTGYQNGEEFAGGSAEGEDLELGSGTMIDGFEDGLIGLKKGDTKELNLTFPEDYREAALAGQSVVFDVTVNAVKEKRDPELTDEFVQSISDYQTVEEYRQGIRDEILTQRQESVDLQIQQTVLQNVVDNSQFDLSRNAISRRYNAQIDQYQEQAKMYGMRLSQLAQSYGMDEGSFKEYVYASVEDDAKNQLVLNTIAAQEGIAVTDEARQELADMNGQTVEEGVEAYGQESFDQMALNRQVMKFLAENAVNEAETGTDAQTATDSNAEETTAAASETEETTAAASETEETTAADSEE
ncbi:MAG TPA: trigger factor [Candidatus Enterocloster excrementipullorum]|uniref:peptidylprolyl isomerase n=1 Tax=Candidatus Enterocloster excrementipullorum TaxID=2838559 RepID=A0A9D2SH51_9FIRM|nr:trigger factor [Candidatus Enterocloster excrementipullorum]